MGQPVNEILKKIGYDKNFDSDITLTIKKEFPMKYSLDEDSLSVFSIDNKIIVELFRKIKNAIKEISSIRSFPFETLELENLDVFKSQYESYYTPAKQELGQITDESLRNRFSKLLDMVKTDFKIYEEAISFEKRFVQEFQVYIPNFILFSSFDDKVPNKIPFSELETNNIIRDLTEISDLDIELIKQMASDRNRQKHKKDVNIKLREDYETFWTQDASNLSIDWDSNNLFFWIEENNFVYEPEIRSKGRQWHLAFYIRVTAKAKEDAPNVILIDEPGLFLHAKAQKDILGKLEACASSTPVIFSTHSPYLIDSNKLNRVRLVTRTDDEGTKITKLHAGADKETLTPILTAIGEDVSIGIKTDKKNSIVVEGISDYFYLHSFKKIINHNKDINVVPCTGGKTPIYVGSILFGWGINPIFCLDSDKSGEEIKKELQEKLGIDEKQIIKVIPSGGAIEDIFTKEDFKKHILEAENDYKVSNSRYIKDNKNDKVLLAKKFYEMVEKGDITRDKLDDETIQNIKYIFERLDSVIEEVTKK
ncbi:MAG: AAA family ATPase [Candidatus Methanoperedens sp.]|nr:AAA family ATPase [Candidatus Methanoperedens sp.]